MVSTGQSSGNYNFNRLSRHHRLTCMKSIPGSTWPSQSNSAVAEPLLWTAYGVVDAIEVVVGAATGPRLLLPLVKATTKPATAPTPSAPYRRVLSFTWARFTPAGAPGESGPPSPARAAEVDKAKARKQESSRICGLLGSSNRHRMMDGGWMSWENYRLKRTPSVK
jgi:hypothetical protein